MSYDYSPLAAMASQQIKAKGAPVIIQRQVGESVDPVTGAYTPGSTSNLNSNGITRSITQDDRATFGDVQGNDRTLILDDSEEPQEGDRVEVDGEYWSIARIDQKKPGITPLVYRVLIRK